jgi:hypothetical protein
LLPGSVLQAFSYRSVESILESTTWIELPLTPEDPAPRVSDHVNVRPRVIMHFRTPVLDTAGAAALPLTDHDFDPSLN